MAKNGSDVLVLIGAVKISGETTNSLNLVRDAIETTHKHSAERAKTYIPGEKGATISVSGCLDPTNVTDYGYSTAFGAYNAATVVTFKVGGIVAGDKYYTGSAFITSLTLDNPQNDRSTFSMDLQISGPVEEATVGT
jgi:predicted secreted protein